ncbi:MAG: SpoIID/LytB domain-containing protein [Thermoanaerobaculia bacterium]
MIRLADPRGRLLIFLAALACARAVMPPGPTSSAPLEVLPSAETAAREPPASVAPRGAPPKIPHKVRVGLLTDQESIELPCCSADIVAVVGGRILVTAESIRVAPAVERSSPGTFRLQIAALRDEEQALNLARTVEERMQVPTSVVFDAGTGLYRVRAGSYEDRDVADRARRVFNQYNFHDVWVVSEQESLINPGLRVERGDKAWVVRGRWLRIRSTSGRGIAMGDKTYRGDLMVFLNNRGTLNLVNEVTLDDYLRGVVPREMGPKIFDHLDALKAQAVAARTYTLKNMGEFTEEGYDICATPRCQVYGGMTSEDPLSDRAVLETSAEVLLHDGHYADTLYSSTCGGHTENVEVVFPLKTEAYLRGVPCLEAGVDRIGEARARGVSLEAELARRLVPAVAAGDAGGSVVTELHAASDFAVRLHQLVRLAGYAAPEDELASLDRREVQRFLSSQLGLTPDARLFVSPEDVPYLLEDPPSEWDADDLRLAAYLTQAGLLSGPLDEPLSEAGIEEVLFHLAVFLRLVEVREVRYLERTENRLRVRDGGEVHELDFDSALRTFRRLGEREEAAPVALLPGDRLTVYLREGRLMALRHSVDPDGVAFDRTSNMSTWTRFRTDGELAQRVAERYPGLAFKRFEILGRGVSGRVSEIEIVGGEGDSVTVRGLPIRWTLDLPDTLFTARRLDPPGREGGWLFSGRGWGHGVGLCQVGSYGMAMRGHDYREILNHYYRGVEMTRINASPETDRRLGR